MSLSVDTTSLESSEFEDDDDAYALDSLISSSPSAYTHTFTSPAPEHHLDDSQLNLKDIPAADRKETTHIKTPQLPIEVIDYIASFLFDSCSSGCFFHIHSFSLVCSQFRHVALRHYFSSIRIVSAKQLAAYTNFHFSLASRNTPCDSVGLDYVKTLTAPSHALEAASWNPSLYRNLKHLIISFSSDGRQSQTTRLKRIFSPPAIPLITWFLPQLTSLTMTKLWRIDVTLLKTVASAFPSVKVLHLSCSEQLDVSCCWPCFEESSSAVVHSPIPNYFHDITRLTDSFADSLETLTQLTDLHLGIFLSDEEMVEKHLEHYDTPLAFDHTLRTAFSPKAASPPTGNILSQPETETTTGLISYSIDKDDEKEEPRYGACTEDLPFPHGPELCRTCNLIGSASKVRTRELEASLALARKIKTLRTVGWSSFFSHLAFEPDEKYAGDWRRRTTVYILRANGRVRVRRRPW
ncbi:hypothetical protein DEU56DRAFT_587760 [Suillus clintonianus]|uniref:uncharacterized protein n=1 Tax=Suillus clintonianus TaxID=1904413 RepID=UPI001B884A47|nr:uncharacterized protein DEU56DRAFT_587760 [Suillus clintonianus]KAG2125060.1 hypothetical protein DEU56DRAFT_587760 [Suillus clintonianus]